MIANFPLKRPIREAPGGAFGRRLAIEWRPYVETVWKPSVPAAEIRRSTRYTRGCALFGNEGARLDR
jgi:hypothetical protein